MSLVMWLGQMISQVETCDPNGITTHPEGPVNPIAPSEEWLNSFNWYANDGVSLLQYALHDMLVENPNQFNMSHPYSDQNAYSYLTYPELQDLDMYPEDGWELISVNLGSFPNGELLSEDTPALQSEYSEIPYLLLYNKQRGIIRLFANTLTGLMGNFDSVLITLGFESWNSESSTAGLLRHQKGFDLALDQPTQTLKVSSVVAHPNNSMKWFQADFQVGYDPCTCFYRSDIRINFTFIKESYINMTSNSLSQNIPLLDANGHSLIPNDFLASVEYNNNNFAGSGVVIYNNMTSMIDQYIERLEYVKNYNTQVDAQNKSVKRKLAILKAFKFVVLGTNDLWVSGALAEDVQEFAREIVSQIGFDGSQVKIDRASLLKMTEDALGEGFKWLNKQFTTQEKLPTPTIPTATLGQATFSGQIADSLFIQGPKMFNPGTYPNGTGNVAINPHNYPVYNEILGLFALLETPKLEFYSKGFASVTESANNYSNQAIYLPQGYINTDCNNDGYQTDNLFIGRTSNLTSYSESKFRLSEPLKFKFNPAVNIDLEGISIKAALVVRANTPEHPPGHAFSIDGYELPEYHYFRLNPIGTNANWNIHFYNSDFSELGAPNNFDNPFDMSTPFVDLSVFNNVVAGVQFYTTSSWVDNISYHEGQGENQYWADKGICEYQYPFELANEELIDYAAQMNLLTNIRFELKLMVTMPFDSPGHSGQYNSSVQVFTYEIPSENITHITGELPVPFSINNSPYQGSLSDNISIGSKIWTEGDFNFYGGTIDGNAEYEIRPYAISTIEITGDQSRDADVSNITLTARDEIIVHGECILPNGFNLVINEFNNITETPTTQVSNEYLGSYCQNSLSNAYNANEPSRGLTASAVNKPMIPERNISRNSFSLFPNPASTELSISFINALNVQVIQVYSSMGKLVKEISKSDIGIDMIIKYDLSNLASGAYYLKCMFRDGTYGVRDFAVIK